MNLNNSAAQKIVLLLKEKNLKTIGSNVLSLYVIKLVSATFPIVIIPIVISIIGDRNYGKYVYSFAIIEYLKIVINYGFQFTGTRDISRCADNNRLLKRKSSEIILVRIVLALAASIVLIGFGFIYYDDRWLYFFGVGSLIGFALQSNWYFQGIQKMHIMSILTILSKLIVLILIFIFIKKEADFIYLNLFDSFSHLIVGLISITVINSYHGLNIFRVQIKQIYKQFHVGFKIFISTILISFYREANIIILYQTGNLKLVAYYSIAEKIIKSIQGINQPITQALFPYFSKAIKSESGIKNFLRIRNYLAAVFLILSLVIVLIAPRFTLWYLGENYERVAANLMVMAPIVFFGVLNYYYGVIGLINKNEDLAFTKFVGIAALINLTLCIILTRYIFDMGASIALLTSEIVLSVLLVLYWNSKFSTNK